MLKVKKSLLKKAVNALEKFDNRTGFFPDESFFRLSVRDDKFLLAERHYLPGTSGAEYPDAPAERIETWSSISRDLVNDLAFVALGYLIGEKLMNFVQAAERYPEFEEELPEFISEIKSIFQPWEISEYLENVKRVGALGHVCTDEEYEDFKNAGAVPQDIDFGINDILTLGKIRDLLLL